VRSPLVAIAYVTWDERIEAILVLVGVVVPGESESSGSDIHKMNNERGRPAYIHKVVPILRHGFGAGFDGGTQTRSHSDFLFCGGRGNIFSVTRH